MNDSSMTNNPALPALVLLLCLMFVVWAAPRVLGVVLALTKELLLVLVECGEQAYWEGWRVRDFLAGGGIYCGQHN